MFKKKEQTRLGDILISKGLITQEQLASAIQEQSRRKRLLDPADTTFTVAPLGEILIEMGFIDRMQLKRGLNWQQRLRHASIAMALCAPFMMFMPSIARAAPVTIQAEHYSTMSGVHIEGTTDVGGGTNIGGINTGDWVTYNIDVPATGSYKIVYRVASTETTAKLVLQTGAGVNLAPAVAVPNTGGWQTWKDVEQVVTLTQGAQALRIFAQEGGVNLNWFKIEHIAPEPEPESELFSKLIQAEEYSSMSGVHREGTSDVGGGINIGGIGTGDWAAYSIDVPAAGNYKVVYRVASAEAAAKLVLQSGTGVNLASAVAVPNTGGWQAWKDVEQVVTLAKGPQTLKIFAQVGGFNLNWLKVENIKSAPEPEPELFSKLIQAEDYSSMSGVHRESTSDVGGGVNIGGLSQGKWMAYNNISIPTSGSYKITYRVATLDAGSLLQLKSSNGSSFGAVNVPVTGGWQKWIDIDQVVTLSAGTHNLTVLALAGGFNVNWIKIESANGTSALVPPPVTVNSSSSSSSSAPSTAVSSSSSSKPSTAISSSWSSSSAANSNTQHVAGSVGITWTAPSARENGEFLDIVDLGGYEIRYKKVGDSTYTYISIDDAWTTSYQFPWLDEGDYIFQIAAFDKNGVYSPFVDIQRQ